MTTKKFRPTKGQLWALWWMTRTQLWEDKVHRNTIFSLYDHGLIERDVFGQIVPSEKGREFIKDIRHIRRERVNWRWKFHITYEEAANG